MATVAGLKETIEKGKEEIERVDAKLGELALSLPNIPDPDAPEGMTEEDAVVVREVGELPEFDFEPRDHLEIGTELDLIDMEAAAPASPAPASPTSKATWCCSSWRWSAS